MTNPEPAAAAPSAAPSTDAAAAGVTATPDAAVVTTPAPVIPAQPGPPGAEVLPEPAGAPAVTPPAAPAPAEAAPPAGPLPQGYPPQFVPQQRVPLQGPPQQFGPPQQYGPPQQFPPPQQFGPPPNAGPPSAGAPPFGGPGVGAPQGYPQFGAPHVHHPLPQTHPGYAYGWPPQLPPQPRRNFLWPVLTTLLVVSMVLALGGAAAATWALRGGGGSQTDLVSSTWVDMRPGVGVKAIEELLQRHTQAVKKKDLNAWMADVEQSDAAFVKRQKQLFDNLVKMPFSDISFDRTKVPARQLAKFLPTQLFDRYHAAVHVEAVTIRHRIEGVDSKTVAIPWMPVVALTKGKWLIVGDAAGKDMPIGANGQPWDSTGPVAVLRNDRIIAVVSADDAERGRNLLQMAETSLKQVAEVRPTGWDGKVLFTAVQDKRIFDTYFAESQERIAQVAAIAVPYYNEVGDWAHSPAYSSTRVVFNPTQLTAQTDELAHDLTHEFAHAAMGPVTTARTPRWVVEGFAEYVAYKKDRVSATDIRQVLGNLTISTLPTDDEFYSEPRNYIASWLANRMIAEKFGQDKLIAFYEAFQNVAEVESAARAVLGIGVSALEQQWRDYVAEKRG
ncbi:hypothetical protein AB0K00_03170 [Dactylosporangium sp. NPDC049525]|uniref:peptidase MA family metallohydrolase n=1 Tax=Dactylosporangium sp. NPDC049525 TaxID=3154730 RepID=UPI00342232FB